MTRPLLKSIPLSKLPGLTKLIASKSTESQSGCLLPLRLCQSLSSLLQVQADPVQLLEGSLKLIQLLHHSWYAGPQLLQRLLLPPSLLNMCHQPSSALLYRYTTVGTLKAMEVFSHCRKVRSLSQHTYVLG